jgi:hypothetical protein
MADEPRTVIKQILDEAIPELSRQIESMSQGCGGGRSGVPPLNWGGRQAPGHSAIQALGAARAALGEGRIDDTKQQILSGLSDWNTLVSSLHMSCEEGPHGEDPVNYGNYVRYRDQLAERLRITLRFL